MTVTLPELESRLWAAANSLRGPVEHADFKAYVFPVLFFKRISDTWDYEHRRALIDFGNDETLALHPDNYRFQVPDECHWRDIRRKHKNVGVHLQTALDLIQQANPTTLGGIFGDVAWGNTDRLPEHALNNLLKSFDEINLDPGSVSGDMLGAAYEYLLREFAEASGKKAGEFFTPPPIVQLLTHLLDPQPGESIYDPACGSAGILVEAVNEVRDAGGDTRTLRLYGQEVNLTTAAIARMNLYIHDIEDFDIKRGDTLRTPKFHDSRNQLARFDVVIANPPFSLKNWGGEAWQNDPWKRSSWGTPPKGNGDYAWIQHMVSSMHPKKGRVGVVMPHGALFRAAESEIRAGLINENLLEAVIGLPQNLFYSTSIPACIMIFRAVNSRIRENRKEEGILFIDGSQRYVRGRTRNTMDASDLKAIIDSYRSGEDALDGSVTTYWAPRAEIKKNGWDLNLGRYLKSAVVESVDVHSALKHFRQAQDSLREAESRFDARLKAAGYEQ
ncbi:type I restriction-modification system subunit M [Streptomyces inhibens]|uniref:type I restriction-modification system subunit M n=1 Tax=Streptomyces inhibens TaxID=2293571 RepID=UPI001EE77015|nr:class I SAM-dependent DNA methyltransferase [Streptomyces inhibens]UKY49840.1 type I restriction-modification system subunit M [Streptomyces inhibens]